MISPKSITRKDANDAGVSKAIDSYYQEEKDDYYTRDKQPSEWYGELSSEFGLNGSVEKADFTELLEGKRKGEILRNNNFKRNNANDRLGLDLTFNAPKSVSIQALVAGDTRLIEAHNEAVKESLTMIEEHAQARKKVKGKSRIENTGKLAIAMFRHDTNRNNDPHLHTHSVVLNITKRKDEQYRALHNDKLVKAIPQASQAYQTNLAKRCKELGYDIKLNDNGTFDLAHISREQINEFSTRSKQIEKVLAERGLDRKTANREQKQMANFVTKQRKRLLPKNQVQEKWAITAKKIGLDKILSPNYLTKNKETKNERTIERKRTRSNGLNHQLTNGGYRGNQRSRGSRGLHDGNGSDGNSKRTIPDNSINQPNTSKYERRQTTKNGLHKLSSSNVAILAKRAKVLLQNNKRFQLHGGRTNRNIRLRWNHGSSGTSGKLDNKFKGQKEINVQKDIKHLNEKKFSTIQSNKEKQPKQKKETLKDMMTYQPPTSELTKKWKRVAEDLRINLDPGKVSNEKNGEFSGEKLINHVIEHLSDKRVDMTREKIHRETLIKGMGEINNDEAKKLIDSKIKQGVIIKAEPLYKIADDKGESTAKTFSEWKKTLVKDIKLSEEDAKKQVRKGIKEGRLLPLEERYVTKKDLQQEKNILRIMEQGRGVKQSLYTNEEASSILDKTTLNNGQKSAASLIMTTKDRVVGIQGYAGVGKSYTLSQMLPEIEKAGATTHIFAPYGSQVKSLQKDGLEANTLAKLLNSQTMQEDIDHNSIIIVDEAGVIPNKDAEQLLTLAEQKNAKIVLIGDTEQTKAIASGKPFDLLQNNQMSIATIDDIQRQKNETLKKAVIESAMGDPKKSVKTLKKSIHQVKSTEDRLDILVDKFMSYDKKEREDTLVVTGTNADKDYINDQIRSKLGLKGKGYISEQLKRVDLSEAETKHARYYKAGMQIESQKKPNSKEIKQGQLYTVKGNERHTLIVEDSTGKEIRINPTKEKLAVYQTKEIEISKGDKLRISKGDKSLGTVTGDKLEVESVNSKKILAKNKDGEVFSFNTKDKHHLDHDYSSTVHSSQGLTVSNVLINIDTKSRTTSKEVYYVAISRAKNQAFVVTDNTKSLPRAISRGAEKHSAYQLVNNDNKEQSFDKKKKKQHVHAKDNGFHI